LTDQEIIYQIRNGNNRAFRELVIKYESQIAATIYGMVGKSPEAEDIGLEVFIKFYQSLARFKGESTVGTYLTRIAINLSLNELKRRKKNKVRFMPESDHDLKNKEGDNDHVYNYEKEIIQEAIEKLDYKFRSVVVLRMIDGYSTEETANILDIPLGTVLSRLARAQQKLKEYLLPILQV
jgi:RNA polymerase sigma-70 factor (ECF subfamily)